jgi:hypothetical protein
LVSGKFFFGGGPKWEGAQIFLGPLPCQKPLGTALSIGLNGIISKSISRIVRFNKKLIVS